MVRKYQPDICFVTETHVQFSRLSSFWTRLGYSALAVVEAQGHAGGIWAMGLSTLPVNVEVVDLHAQAVTLKFSTPSATWVCTGVYASPVPTARRELWTHMREISSSFVGPWAVLGDFNDIASATEQRGGYFLGTEGSEFC